MIIENIQHNINNLEERIESNAYTLFGLILYVLYIVIPFTTVDLYYSYQDNYECLSLKYPINSNMSLRLLLRINGYAYVFFICYVTLILCRLIDIFNNTFIMKLSLCLKLIYNITWSILSTIVFSNISNKCDISINSYIIVRLIISYLFIIFSIKRLKNVFSKTS